MDPSSAVGSPIFYFVAGVAVLGIGIFFLIALIRAIIAKTRGWILAAVISGVLGLFGVVGLFGAAATSIAKLAKTAKQKKKTMASKNGSYQLEVPASWRDMPELHQDAEIRAGDGVQEQYVIVAEHPKSDFGGTLAEFEELIAGQMKGNISGGEISEPESRPVGAYPAIHRRLAGTVKKLGIVYHVSLIETKTSFYQVLTWTMKSRESAAAPVFREVVDSFTSKDGPPAPKAPAPGPNASIHERVVWIVTEQLGLDSAKVKPESRFIEDLGADSLDTVELVMATEEEFEVSIPDEVAEKLITVGDLVRWLEKKPAGVE
jgi:acyl carrier protein